MCLQLASDHWGVISIKWKEVSCDRWESRSEPTPGIELIFLCVPVHGSAQYTVFAAHDTTLTHSNRCLCDAVCAQAGPPKLNHLCNVCTQALSAITRTTWLENAGNYSQDSQAVVVTPDCGTTAQSVMPSALPASGTMQSACSPRWYSQLSELLV